MQISDSLGIVGTALDGAGHVYVMRVGSQDIAEYSADLSTLIATLGGSKTGLSNGSTEAFAVDAAGDVYVGLAGASNVSMFAPLAAGANNVAPVSVLRSGASCPPGPIGCVSNVTVDASGDVFLIPGGSDVYEFRKGSTVPIRFAGGVIIYGLAVEGDRLYFSFIGTPAAHPFDPAPAGLGYFDLTNPRSKPVPYPANNYPIGLTS